MRSLNVVPVRFSRSTALAFVTDLAVSMTVKFESAFVSLRASGGGLVIDDCIFF